MGILTSATKAIQRLIKPTGGTPAPGADLQILQERRRRLLYISAATPPDSTGPSLSVTISMDGAGEVNLEGPAEPSTIYTTVPVSWPAPDTEQTAPLGYFPSYVGMTPDQRGVYLAWLQDISRPIDIGYVFTYYYGLERQLVTGDFDTALVEVVHLRRHHLNKSFQAYSGAALLHACLMRNRPDALEELYSTHKFDYFGNSCLLLLHRQKLELLPDMMISLAQQLPGVNRRYLKTDPDLYRESLVQVLLEAGGKPSYEFSSRHPLECVEAIPYPIFANYSLPPDTRAPALPNLIKHEPFQQEIGAIYQNAHERTKLSKRMRSKSV